MYVRDFTGQWRAGKGWQATENGKETDECCVVGKVVLCGCAFRASGVLKRALVAHVGSDEVQGFGQGGLLLPLFTNYMYLLQTSNTYSHLHNFAYLLQYHFYTASTSGQIVVHSAGISYHSSMPCYLEILRTLLLSCQVPHCFPG